MLRLATYNVEWFDMLFDDSGRVLDDAEPSARHGVSRREQIAALGRVFRALDADAVMVIEAPDQNRRRSTCKALEAFARHQGLRQSAAVIGFSNDSQQEIALIYDPAVCAARHEPGGTLPLQSALLGGDADPRFDQRVPALPGQADKPQDLQFSKPPLEVTLTLADSSQLRLIGVHLKSKAPYGTRSKAQAVRVSTDNRRKHLAQCQWLRRRILGHLVASHPLVVLGDFNDGPGLDDYEKVFGRSGLELVLGWDGPQEQRLFDPHATWSLGGRSGPMPTSARFHVGPDKGYLTAMLDYVMVSPDLRALDPQWRIWHPFDDPACAGDSRLQQALLTASDHFPVSVDLPLSASPKAEKAV